MHIRIREIAEDAERSGDLKGAHLRAAGDCSGIEVFGGLVLVMTYAESEKTAGGIIKTDRAMDEGRFQGKAGLVIALGPQAFVDDARVTFAGQRVEVGDWVMTRPSDGMEIAKVCDDGRAAVSMRLFQDKHIMAKIANPGLVW